MSLESGRYALEFVRKSSKLQQMLIVHPFTSNGNVKKCSVTQNSELKLFYFWHVFSVFATVCTSSSPPTPRSNGAQASSTISQLSAFCRQSENVHM